MELCKILQEARKKVKLSNKQLADRSGVSPSSISLYELGKRNPSERTIIKLAKSGCFEHETILRMLTCRGLSANDANDLLERVLQQPDAVEVAELFLSSCVSEDEYKAAERFLVALTEYVVVSQHARKQSDSVKKIQADAAHFYAKK
jgi:transcriptional regulator with XRE-family HTH domain